MPNGVEKMPKKIVYDKVEKLTKCPDSVINKCDCCKNEAAYFHSKCCESHFEGIIKDGKFYIACDKCGKISGMVVPLDINLKKAKKK
jgi:hypothetical protein